MIKKEDLFAIAKQKGLAIKFAEMDYLQEIALLNISHEFGKRLVFKGGTCLYKLYKLNRFSEDLDFTATKGFKPREFFSRLPFFFNLLDVKCSVSVNEFEKGTNIYLDVNGPLYGGGKESRAKLILNISMRERLVLPELRLPYMPFYHELRPFDIFAMDEREILAEKVRGIYERDKARDVYDLWYLLKRRNISFDEKLARKKLFCKFEREKFLAKIEAKKSSWEKDLGQLIAGELPSFAQVKKEIEELIV